MMSKGNEKVPVVTGPEDDEKENSPKQNEEE